MVSVFASFFTLIVDLRRSRVYAAAQELSQYLTIEIKTTPFIYVLRICSKYEGWIHEDASTCNTCRSVSLSRRD